MTTISDDDAKKIAAAIVAAQQQERAERDAAMAEAVWDSWRVTPGPIEYVPKSRPEIYITRNIVVLLVGAAFILGCFSGGWAVMVAFL